MPAIDRWVVRTPLAWLVSNRAVWTRVPAVFSINLAHPSMTDDNFVGYVEASVTKSGIAPQALCFEITEQFASSGNISVALRFVTAAPPVLMIRVPSVAGSPARGNASARNAR